ncbi:MAG TPA: ATP-binding protein [Candidatus Polarisedimenticolaceae bacterium]|nr:ATP-binding protein [Candidatus Polarisedimenticolaceae bacterium]
MTLAAVLDDPAALAAVALSGIVLVALIAAGILIVVARRSRRREVFAVVKLLEEMRAGRPRSRLDLDPRSPFATIAESANRLGQDLAVRWSRAESADEGFHALQDAARGYAVITTDTDGDLRGFSVGASALFGWEEDAVVGRNASILFDDASWKDLLPKLARKSLRERGVETRALMARRDGSTFHARLTVRLLRGSGVNDTGFLIIVQDVSEQVRVEGELRAAESRARSMLDELPGGVALVQGGRIVYANPALREMLALDEREAAGLLLRDRVATRDLLVVQEALTRLESGAAGETAEASITLTGTDGRESRDVRLGGTAFTLDGRPAALVVLRDEGRERRLARDLAAENGRLDAVIESWEDGVVLIEGDPDAARVRLVNRAFLEAFGLDSDDVAGVTEGDLLRALRNRGDDGAAAAACLAAAGGGPARDLVEAGGRSLAFAAAPVAAADGGAAGRMLVVRDVSEMQATVRERTAEALLWKRRHEATEASHAKLRTLHQELTARRVEAERLNQELRTLDTMKSDLLANVSHELQTPLVSIRGYTEMIAKGRLGPVNDEQKRGLALSLKNIDRLIAMIDNLLAFARMDRETPGMKIGTFALVGVVDEALALLGDRLEAKGITASQRFEDPALAIRGDRDKILQVFLNLLSNAVKFNRERGTIQIEARRAKPGFALVSVTDSGRGIPREDLERVFERFYQTGTTREEAPEGTGIGLAIVRNILRLHGCVIHATSEVGRGSTFSFTLPLAGERTEAREAPAPPAPASPPPPPPAREPQAERGAVRERRPEAKRPPQEDRPRLRIIRRGS